jgi:hypothetical protein
MTYLNNVSLDKIKKWINMPLGRISHCEKRDTWQNKKNQNISPTTKRHLNKIYFFKINEKQLI